MKNNEFKIKKFKDSTVYTLESATSGGTSAGSIASVSKPIGGVQRRTGDNFFTPEDADPIKPRRGPLRPQTGGGSHKDKSKTIPRKEKHKKPMDMSETARLSPDAKLQRAFDREQAKSLANRNRGEKVMSQARTEWEKKQADEKSKKKGVAEGSTTRGGFGGSASQAYHEIEWLKKKIASLPPTKEKQIRDLQRQIRERELAIAFQKEGVAEGRHEFDKKTGQMGYTTADADQRHGLYIDGKLVKTYNTREQADNVKRRDPRFKDATIKKIAEATGDKPFDSMMTNIKKGTKKQATADRKQAAADQREQSRAAFDNMFGGPGAGIGNLSIRKGPSKDVEEDHSTATDGWGKASKGAIYRSGELAGAGHSDRMMEDQYVSELFSRLSEKLDPNAPVDVWVQDFQRADPNRYHQFKNKTPAKKAQMAASASYAAKNPSKRR